MAQSDLSYGGFMTGQLNFWASAEIYNAGQATLYRSIFNYLRFLSRFVMYENRVS